MLMGGVTADMVKKALKLKCCVRAVLSMSRGLCEDVMFFDTKYPWTVGFSHVDRGGP